MLPGLALGRAVGEGDADGLADGAVVGREGVVVVTGALVAGGADGDGDMRTVSVGVQDAVATRVSANSPAASLGSAFILSVITLIGS